MCCFYRIARRDIKIDNIILAATRDRPAHAMVIDLDLAKEFKQGEDGMVSGFCGKEGWTAIEVKEGVTSMTHS